MPEAKKKIQYDFTLLPDNDEAQCLTPDYARLYEEHFPMFKELFGDVILDTPGAYRVTITEYEDLRTVTCIRVYYY